MFKDGALTILQLVLLASRLIKKNIFQESLAKVRQVCIYEARIPGVGHFPRLKAGVKHG